MLATVALVAGRSLARIIPDLFEVDSPPPLSDGAPNLWSIVQALPWIGGLPLIGLAMAIAFGATAWLAASFSARPPRGERLLSAALLVAMIVPGLSPQMQPQDFAVATGLSLILAYRAHEPMIGALVIGSWLLAIFVSPVIGATPMIVATLLVARPFLASPANDNGLPLNPVMAYPG